MPAEHAAKEIAASHTFTAILTTDGAVWLAGLAGDVQHVCEINLPGDMACSGLLSGAR